CAPRTGIEQCPHHSTPERTTTKRELSRDDLRSLLAPQVRCVAFRLRQSPWPGQPARGFVFLAAAAGSTLSNEIPMSIHRLNPERAVADDTALSVGLELQYK